jgi:dihydroorotate dehydrogenase (fumarate)
MVDGFNHDPARHQYAFFDAATYNSGGAIPPNSSVNSLGYSPVTLEEYLRIIKDIAASPAAKPSKGFIISVTGTPNEVAICYQTIAKAADMVPFQLAMEINLSCPNIPGAPPPAYSSEALMEILTPLVYLMADMQHDAIPCGIKTPPYAHAAEFQGLIGALLAIAEENKIVCGNQLCPMSFITATNTLGNCLLLEPQNPGNGGQVNSKEAHEPSFAEQYTPTLPNLGLGGMAGAALHPLALGNVATLRRMLNAKGDRLGHIQVIGVGGVSDEHGYQRMRAVGADFVGVGTALGIKGVDVFRNLEKGLQGKWDTVVTR